MKQKIVEALQKLDPQNDNQWTQDGLPKLDALKFLVGDTVTREQVQEAAPDFTRTNTTIGEKANDGSNDRAVDNAAVQVSTDEQKNSISPDGTVAGAAAELGKETQSHEIPYNEPVSDPGKVGLNAPDPATVEEVKASGNVVTMSVGVNVELSDVLKNFIGDFHEKPISELSDEELLKLHEAHNDIVSADNEFQSAVNEFIRKRAFYLNDVATAVHDRVLQETTMDQLAAFRAQVGSGKDLPVNRPQQVQRRGPQFLGHGKKED
jgi:hypothetical protein